jgi:hypothetical protein
MRDERAPAITYPSCYDPDLQCPCTIRLDTQIYRCTRVAHDSGIHDAGCKHSDGFLVRW